MATNSTVQDSPAIFDLKSLRAGDIVFAYSGSSRLKGRLRPNLNVTGQRLLMAVRRKHQIPLRTALPRYSHVMLGLGNGLVIHADGKKVCVEIISDALKYDTDDAASFRIYRRRDLSPAQGRKIADAATRYYEQKYRFLSFFLTSRATPEADNTQFCSRLVAKAFRSVGAPVSRLPDHRTLPLDLYNSCQSSEWIDVSCEFKQQPIAADIVRLIEELIGLQDSTKGSPQKPLEQPCEGDRNVAEGARTLLSVKFELARDMHETIEKVIKARSEHLAWAMTLHPDRLDDNGAKQVATVLEDLKRLLNYAFLTNIDKLDPLTSLDTSWGLGEFAGLPEPAARQKLRRSSATNEILADYRIALIGLLSVFGGRRVYPAGRPDYIELSASLLSIRDIARFEVSDCPFSWVEDEQERETFRKHFRAIVMLCKELDRLQGVAQVETSEFCGPPEVTST